MDFGGWHWRLGAQRGQRAVIARMLMLVVALTFAARTAALAEDLAFHAGGHHGQIELPMIGTLSPTEAIDPGIACHIDCGCHVVATQENGPVAPSADVARPHFPRVAEAPFFVAPECLVRPPRA
ncbi:hypothetical protein [Methylobacterium oxalidis]|uniref:hypothetical protein n=1 Tax=Methylobacterium oxalidis TaxID=944322 RepID=UPI0033153E75